ncbi:hypothetical protein [Humibacter ginsenosidimutans]|uniref:Uncharacterized protein n=1 Tax=Humibacter ginsenosidimutans TaxID=2599293 RepID=A0A5B8M3H1_9MICO|nr:hypothetical protein [Humibacter ginsenosidimutans]QDZ14494.1 hypothetical protein FPZ11_06725 [Humibacter ginsenosidimutans]
MSEGYTVGSGVSGNGRYPRRVAQGTRADDLPRPWGWWLWLLFGLVFGVIGLLPWLLTGMTLPLQNLWSTDAAPSDMPSALLPLSQYRLGMIVALIVVGSAAAGIVARSAHRYLSAGGFWALTAGVGLVQLTALGQSAFVIGVGLGDGVASVAYLAVMVLVVLISMLGGVAVLALIARAPRGGALIGIALVAAAFAQWAAGIARVIVPSGQNPIVMQVMVWLPALVVAVAIIWCGVNTVGRVIAAIVALLLLWISSPLSTAVAAAAGTRVLARSPYEMADYGVGVFRMALFEVQTVLLPVAAAIVVAAVGLLVRGLMARSRRRNAPQQYSREDEVMPFDDRGAFVVGSMGGVLGTGAIDTVPAESPTEELEYPTRPLGY